MDQEGTGPPVRPIGRAIGHRWQLHGLEPFGYMYYCLESEGAF